MNNLSLTQRAAQIRLLCLDVDGTLTNGKLYMSNGIIGRAFCVLDGLGVQRFISAGGVAAIITAAKEEEGGIDIRVRAAQMGINHIYTGVHDKLAVMQQLLQAENIAIHEAAFVGDDLPDLTAIQHAGFSAAPPDAAKEVLAAADYICTQPAGAGAVREVCEYLLASRQVQQSA